MNFITVNGITRAQCVIDLAGGATRSCATLDVTGSTVRERYTKRRGNFIELVIRYTQRPLIRFPLESKASRVKCSDRHGGTSVPVGEIFQTARNWLVTGKQIVRLSRANRICVVKVGASAARRKIFMDKTWELSNWKIWKFLQEGGFSRSTKEYELSSWKLIFTIVLSARFERQNVISSLF